MEFFPKEIILIIFNYILLITDKRQFLRVCKNNYIMTEDFMEKYVKIYCVKGFDEIIKYPMERFTLELIHDGYFDMIPIHYITLTNDMLIKASAFFNNINLLKNLKKIPRFNYLLKAYVCIYAAKNGQIGVLKWAKKNGYEWTCQTFENAAINGHLSTLQLLYKNIKIVNTKICEIAAEKGYLDILKWAYKKGCDWNSYICECAAKNGQLEVLTWLHENGCPWNIKTCDEASYHGNLNCLQYAHENGCEYDIKTCFDNAICFGHLDCLKYLRNSGFDWYDNLCLNGNKYDNKELLSWLIENGCPVYYL